MSPSTHPQKKIRDWLRAGKYGDRLSTGTIASARHTDFYNLANSLCGAMARKCSGGSQIVAVATDHSGVTAWALRDPALDPDLYLVLVTKGLFDEMDRLAQLSSVNVMSRFAVNAQEHDIFLEFWGRLPQTPEYATTFSAMVIHIALAFVVQHELAHIAAGHLPVFGRLVVQNEGSAVSLDEAAVLESATKSGSEVLVRQCLEVDADMNALHWMVEYLSRVTPQVLTNFGAVDQVVWSAFCGSPRGRRYVLFLSTCVLYSALGARSFKRDEFLTGSHPPAIARMMLLLHVENALANQRGELEGAQTGALLHCIEIMALRAQADATLDAKINNQPDIFADMTGKEIYAKMLLDLGINDALQHWHQIGSQFRSLATERGRLESELVRLRPVSDSDEFLRWY